MAKTEIELRDDIVRVGQFVYQKGWVASNDGNISVRLDDKRILCTPTNISKGMMTPDDLIIVDMAGNKLEGRRERTSEILMHTTIYSLRPDVRAVVHTHPPVATGFAAAGRGLTQAVLPEVVVTLGSVPLVSYGLPGTPELTEPMMPLIPKFDALLLANHGAVCYAEDLWQAYNRMDTLEHTARILLVAELLGGANLLPRVEVAKLIGSRERYGITSKAINRQEMPQTLEDVRDATQVEKFQITRDELIAIVEEAMRVKA